MSLSLEDIPADLATFFGINELSAQVILSIMVIFTVLLPTMILTKGKAPTIYLMVFFLAECLLVGIGWLNFWILIATVVLMAFGVATLGAGGVLGDSN